MVSVIIATYNRMKFLKQAVASCQQCEGVSEIIIVDDGSTEQSYLNLSSFYADSTEVVVHQYGTNGGSPRCFNKGLELATGDYVSFLGDDDIFCASRFKAAISILREQDDVDIVIESVYSYDSTLENRVVDMDIIVPPNLSGNIFDLLTGVNGYHLSLEGMTIRRKSMSGAKFDCRLKISQDTDFIWELCKEGKVQGVDYKDSYVKRRVHSSNITKDVSSLYRCSEILYQKWFTKSLNEACLRSYRLRFFRHYAHWLGVNRYGLDAKPLQKLIAYAIAVKDTMS